MYMVKKDVPVNNLETFTILQHKPEAELAA